jgi:anti-anti-sigma regulatory factor
MINQAQVYILGLEGSLVNDIQGRELEKILKRIEEEPNLKGLVVDQEDAGFHITSNYARRLYSFFHNIKRNKHCEVSFVNIQGKFKVIFGLSGMDQNFPTYTSLEEAIKSYSTSTDSTTSS